MVAALVGASLLSALIWAADSGRAAPDPVASVATAEFSSAEGQAHGADTTGAMLNNNSGMKADIRAAVSTFVWAVSNRDAEAVWHFASEDHQANLETEIDALKFFIGIHPPLAHARQMQFDGFGFDDDGAHATAYITDRKGKQWLAWFALSQDPVGDWKIVNCRVRLAPGDLA
jgi:hypothetical protein